MTVVEDIDEVERRARRAGGPLTLIFDADNTIVRDGAPLAEFGEQVNALIDRFEALPPVERVVVLTNGRQRGVERMMGNGYKPFTSRRRLGRPAGDVWVIGDQILTDGLLAWRLGATFFHQVIDRSGERPAQAIMRAAGTIAGRLFLDEKQG